MRSYFESICIACIFLNFQNLCFASTLSEDDRSETNVKSGRNLREGPMRLQYFNHIYNNWIHPDVKNYVRSMLSNFHDLLSSNIASFQYNSTESPLISNEGNSYYYYYDEGSNDKTNLTKESFSKSYYEYSYYYQIETETQNSTEPKANYYTYSYYYHNPFYYPYNPNPYRPPYYGYYYTLKKHADLLLSYDYYYSNDEYYSDAYVTISIKSPPSTKYYYTYNTYYYHDPFYNPYDPTPYLPDYRYPFYYDNNSNVNDVVDADSDSNEDTGKYPEYYNGYRYYNQYQYGINSTESE